ncbi:hypothetical protein D3C81_1671610 [compost metagenome]
MRQGGGVDAVLLFQLFGEVFVHPRRFRQGVIFIVMTLRFRQQVFRGSDQLVQLPAVNLARHAALQAEHSTVEGDARLVEADPGVSKFRDVLAGELRDGEIVFVIIQSIDEHPGGDQLNGAQPEQHRD